MVHIFSPLAGLSGRIRSASVLLGLSLVLAGCATVPPPDDSMNQAQTQLQEARDAGAADYAPVDLGFAQDKFQQAQSAMADRKYEIAANLAEESRADSELARAKARLGASRAQIQNRVQENSHLREEGEQAAAEAARQEQQAPPMPSSSSSSTLPSQDPPQDMPAPSSSVLNSQPAGDGFQTLPENNPQPPSNPQPDSDTQGAQP
ncbi:DUF4398 domain-containing protein [Rhodanobacter sp. L36]|uniref:DUF4398 domain-containing protein n=1 Tax=Rhodanobacter sp. L36 TaxID=1747221 RepID=UPI0020B12482|nr:DUF4398 domain-containing protein [Rhodanobacter sp. L36]